MSLSKAWIECAPGEQGPPKVTAWFNPEKLTIKKNANWEDQKVLTANEPVFQWTSGTGEDLDVELFFDGYEEKKSVREPCKNLLGMAAVQPKNHRPPQVRFYWGGQKGVEILGVVKSVTITYTMFLPDGTPVRATAAVSIQSGTPARDQKQLQKQPLESPDWEKLHTLRRGETLHAIAEEEYDDPAEWRRIADANGIDNPMDLVPGMRLFIPPILSRDKKG